MGGKRSWPSLGLHQLVHDFGALHGIVSITQVGVVVQLAALAILLVMVYMEIQGV